MTTAEKIAKVKAKVDNDPEATDAVVIDCLEDAADAIFLKMYPWGVPDEVADVPRRYEQIQCRLAARYFLRKGGEGELRHSENGINREYGSVNDADLLQEVMQKVRL